jgi:aspartate kinase
VTVICDATKSADVLSTGLVALAKEKINPQMISQAASKVNISMIVDDAQRDQAVKALHAAYFESGKNNF